MSNLIKVTVDLSRNDKNMRLVLITFKINCIKQCKVQDKMF